jgi:hypothetical protein
MADFVDDSWDLSGAPDTYDYTGDVWNNLGVPPGATSMGYYGTSTGDGTASGDVNPNLYDSPDATAPPGPDFFDRASNWLGSPGVQKWTKGIAELGGASKQFQQQQQTQATADATYTKALQAQMKSNPSSAVAGHGAAQLAQLLQGLQQRRQAMQGAYLGPLRPRGVTTGGLLGS